MVAPSSSCLVHQATLIYGQAVSWSWSPPLVLVVPSPVKVSKARRISYICNGRTPLLPLPPVAMRRRRKMIEEGMVVMTRIVLGVASLWRMMVMTGQRMMTMVVVVMKVAR